MFQSLSRLNIRKKAGRSPCIFDVASGLTPRVAHSTGDQRLASSFGHADTADRADTAVSADGRSVAEACSE